MSDAKEEITNMRKQAFYDSHTNYKYNSDKYRNISDPILQQKDKYVRKKYFLLIINKNYYYVESKRKQSSCRVK